MQWIAPSEKDAATDTLEKRLWEAADQFRANSGLTSAQYSTPVLGLIFLRFADTRFAARRAQLCPPLPVGEGRGEGAASRRRGNRADDPAAYHAEGVLYLPPNARYAELLAWPEGGKDKKMIGAAVSDAMRDIEKHNPQLSGVLPKTYEMFDSKLLKELLKKLSEIPATIDYDAFGRIYEYFLGEFARTEGQKGGEFYTPASIVRLLVEILEPYHGRILDPACGSGGMFVQSARFVSEHKKNPSSELAIYGQEKVEATVHLCRMNLAVHGLEGDIKKAISYYEDLHGEGEKVEPQSHQSHQSQKSHQSHHGRFDFVLANPPFNVNAVDKDRLAKETGPNGRYPFGLPKTDNANYLWIQLFYSSLNEKGRAAFVMANSASDARSSELEIRRKLIEARAVDAIVAVGPNFFYTVTLPCTLWFLDRGKATLPSTSGTTIRESEQQKGASKSWRASGEATRGGDEGKQNRRDSVLFIDARHIYRQIDRAHRDWTEPQISFLANIVRLYRGEDPDFTLGGKAAETKLAEIFGSNPPSTFGTTIRDSEQQNRGTKSWRAWEATGIEGEGAGRRHGTKSEGELRFIYRDVAGLCKVAPIHEIEKQGWSLNPGRYVGVAPGESVSDEDFKEKLTTLNEELETLTGEARELERIIAQSVTTLIENREQ